MDANGARVLSGTGAPRRIFSESDHNLARRSYPSEYCQVKQRHVSFDHIARTWRIRHPENRQATPDEWRASEVLEHLARKRFIASHGEILKDFWTIKPWAGCALTEDGWIHSVNNGTDAELVIYEGKAHQLCRDSHRTFEKAAGVKHAGRFRISSRWRRDSSDKAKRDLRDVGEMLYSVLTRIQGTAAVLEDDNATLRKREEALAAVRIEWTAVCGTVEKMIQRQARFEYFEGVVLGAVITIPILAVAGWGAATQGDSQFSEPGAFTAAIVGGAVGAVISIAQRMTTDHLNRLFTNEGVVAV